MLINSVLTSSGEADIYYIIPVPTGKIWILKENQEENNDASVPDLQAVKIQYKSKRICIYTSLCLKG
jgi:hypothetical protein